MKVIHRRRTAKELDEIISNATTRKELQDIVLEVAHICDTLYDYTLQDRLYLKIMDFNTPPTN